MKLTIFTPLILVLLFSSQGLKAETSPPIAEPQKITANAPQEQVSLNSATAAQLAAILSGVGLKKAENIIRYREQYGPFANVDELQEVPGIGLSLFERNQAKLKL